ncbi:hypothetical protein [Streptomyces europaeiscabiei]|uniref:hypothetical protein n=1 Tax=Streptomyces europaeiscabiei TaxID=146819 RepID=UPI0029B126C2|nr:hypothetical protein [Streptomyces europaeiscabiei]MDX3672739.1 hypothetical protein [Streptomyces europaeiscabiei]
MTTMDTPTTLDWLAQAEAAFAAEQAEHTRIEDAYAAETARDVNAKLATLGITPITPAGTDGRGRLIPAQLAPADNAERFYSVWASFDEDEGTVTLLVGDYRSEGAEGRFEGLRLSVDRFTEVRQVLYARRRGPKPVPGKPARRSADVQAIVRGLDELRSAVDALANTVGRGLSRP